MNLYIYSVSILLSPQCLHFNQILSQVNRHVSGQRAQCQEWVSLISHFPAAAAATAVCMACLNKELVLGDL